MTILGERTKQLDIFCRVTGFTSDFLSFMVVEHIRFFHGALQLTEQCCLQTMSARTRLIPGQYVRHQTTKILSHYNCLETETLHARLPITDCNQSLMSSVIPSSLYSRPAHLGYILHTNSAQKRTVVQGRIQSLSLGGGAHVERPSPPSLLPSPARKILKF